MHLDVRGHPVHTRALGVTLVRRPDGKLDVAASLLDLRKRGFVPVGGDLQASGIVHLMRLAGVVDPAAGTLESVGAEQPAIAFEASALTEGESCRDPIRAVEALAGEALDAGWARRAGAALGGPRGCSHILTLAHLLGSSAAWALAEERRLHDAPPTWRAGERTFRRDLVVDGFEVDARRIQLAAQLTDLHLAPAPPRARPMDRFAAEREVHLLADVAFPSFAITELVVAERRRGRADFERAAWRRRDDTAHLVGLPLAAGAAGALLGRLGDVPDDRPLLDTLLMLAPTLVQCAAALSNIWAVAAQTDPSMVGIGGLADSCYMWRRDGALDRARRAEGGPAFPPRGSR